MLNVCKSFKKRVSDVSILLAVKPEAIQLATELLRIIVVDGVDRCIELACKGFGSVIRT